MKEYTIEMFQEIEITEIGKFRLLNEKDLNQLIALANRSKLLRKGSFEPSLGNIIKNYREEAGLKQGELAREVNLTKASMCNIENGITKKPQQATLLKLCEKLGPEFERTILELGLYKKSA